MTNRPTYTASALVFTLLFIFSAMIVALAYGIGYNDGQDSDNRLPECKYEDSRHCYWDASRSGNRQGRDVINR